MPANHGIEVNERADEVAKAAAEGIIPADAAAEAVPDERRWETGLSHMARVATEARSRATAQWISEHVGPEQNYRPPSRRQL